MCTKILHNNCKSAWRMCRISRFASVAINHVWAKKHSVRHGNCSIGLLFVIKYWRIGDGWFCQMSCDVANQLPELALSRRLWSPPACDAAIHHCICVTAAATDVYGAAMQTQPPCFLLDFSPLSAYRQRRRNSTDLCRRWVCLSVCLSVRDHRSARQRHNWLAVGILVVPSNALRLLTHCYCADVCQYCRVHFYSYRFVRLCLSSIAAVFCSKYFTESASVVHSEWVCGTLAVARHYLGQAVFCGWLGLGDPPVECN